MMPHQEFRILVREMRSAQNAYFKNRTQPNLRKSMRLEAYVDKELKAPDVSEQTTIFDREVTG